MASTGLVALGDSRFAALVQSEVIEELRPAETTKSFLKKAIGGNSTVANFPLIGDPGPATAPADDITDLTSTAMSDTAPSVTAAEVGLRIDVSDLVQAVSVYDVVSQASGLISRSLSEKWETDLAALMDDFTNVTPAASTLSTLDHLAAVSALEQRDIPGPYSAYYSPKQAGELRAEIATTTASFEVGGRNAGLVTPIGSGFFGDYMGVPIWNSSTVVTTAGRVGGAVFNHDALGYYMIWDSRIEHQRDASLRALELNGTMCYGVAEISDTRGQTVTSAS